MLKIKEIHPRDAYFGQADLEYYKLGREVILVEAESQSVVGGFISAYITFAAIGDDPLHPLNTPFFFAAVILEETKE